jgi:hypothetical protein
MSKIDRRAFAVGCLAVTVAACVGDYANKGASFGATQNCDTSSHGGVRFLTPAGCWRNFGNTTTGDNWVYVVT